MYLPETPKTLGGKAVWLIDRIREDQYERAAVKSKNPEKLKKIIVSSKRFPTYRAAIERLDKLMSRNDFLVFISGTKCFFNRDDLKRINLTSSEIDELVAINKDKILHGDLTPFYNFLLINTYDKEIIEKYKDKSWLDIPVRIILAKHYYTDRFDMLSFLAALYFEYADEFNVITLKFTADEVYNEIMRFDPTDEERAKLRKLFVKDIFTYGKSKLSSKLLKGFAAESETDLIAAKRLFDSNDGYLEF
jgi:hypothetical protein